jgi:hypothetical protein
MCISTSFTDIGRSGSTRSDDPSSRRTFTRRSFHSGMNRETGSLSWKWPCSYSESRATPVIGFVIE